VLEKSEELRGNYLEYRTKVKISNQNKDNKILEIHKTNRHTP